MQLDLQLCGSHAKAAGVLPKTARDTLLLADGINVTTIISNTTILKISFAINPPMKFVESVFGLNVGVENATRARSTVTFYNTPRITAEKDCKCKLLDQELSLAGNTSGRLVASAIRGWLPVWDFVCSYRQGRETNLLPTAQEEEPIESAFKNLHILAGKLES